MGKIVVPISVTKGRHKFSGKALVDSGADVTNLNPGDACNIGFDIFSAPNVEMKTAGGGTIRGVHLHNVTIVSGKRRAKLGKVFVPLTRVVRRKDGTEFERRVEYGQPNLLGHDFLQKARAYLDFDTHTLRGLEELGPPVSLSRDTKFYPVPKKDREIMRAVALQYCRIAKTKREKTKRKKR